MNTIHERIRAERERLRMNQTEFGSLAGITKTTQINYEKGTRSPDANYLHSIASAGVDIAYVITGEKTVHTESLPEELHNFALAWEAIDVALYEAGKTLPPAKKRIAAEALYAAVKNGEGSLKSLSKLMTKAA